MKHLPMRSCAALLFISTAAAANPAGAGASAASASTPSDRLVELINSYRAAPPACEGAKPKALPPLAPDARLAQLQVDEQNQLQQAMRTSGYRAARAEAISMSGPPNVREAFNFAAKQHCRMLLAPHYSAIGISQRGKEWRIVLAQPMLSESLGDWRRAGQDVLKHVNAARGTERRCGDKSFPAVPPVRWNEALAAAALKHSEDMMRHNYFAHEGRNGSTVAARVEAQAYRWRQVGENIAAGQGSAERVVQGWLSSPGHCVNIMSANFTEMGAAYAYEPASEAGIYWTQVFGRPR